MSKRIMVIPDTQVSPDNDFSFLENVGKYAVDMKPDIIVHLGDFADMPSLSMHDKAGSKNMEGRRYRMDIDSAIQAMNTLMYPINEEREKLKANHKPRWNPELIMLYGNHENRINRAIQNDPKLDGLISLDDLQYKEFGWHTVPFLESLTIEGVVFSHYFVSGVMGNPCTTARSLLTKHHQSCVAGHQQGRDIAYGKRADGSELTAIIAGSCYEHDENYLNFQTNNHWRGLYILHDVSNGSFDEMPVSLKYLRKRYASPR